MLTETDWEVLRKMFRLHHEIRGRRATLENLLRAQEVLRERFRASENDGLRRVEVRLLDENGEMVPCMVFMSQQLAVLGDAVLYEQCMIEDLEEELRVLRVEHPHLFFVVQLSSD